MIGSKVEAPGAALLHLVHLHLSFLLIEELLNVTCKRIIVKIGLKPRIIRETRTLIRL